MLDTDAKKYHMKISAMDDTGRWSSPPVFWCQRPNTVFTSLIFNLTY